VKSGVAVELRYAGSAYLSQSGVDTVGEPAVQFGVGGRQHSQGKRQGLAHLGTRERDREIERERERERERTRRLTGKRL
jgi:hypothetical protein